jgi:valyl-tRNA synthetase
MILSERFEIARNFMNKLWNAARFGMMRLDGYSPAPIDLDALQVEDRWILSRLSTVTADVTRRLDEFSFAETARILYDFTWSDFCSFYVEMLKGRLSDEVQRPQAQRMLVYILDNILRLLHPVMPFITEDIWQHLRAIAPSRGLESPHLAAEALIIAPWPNLAAQWQSSLIESQFALFQGALGALREIRARQNIAPKKEVDCVIRCSQEIADRLNPLAIYFGHLANAKLRSIGPAVELPRQAATIALTEMEIHVDLAGLIDVGAELARLGKEITRIAGLVAGKESKLSSDKFVANAPAEVVQKERESLQQLREQLQMVKVALNSLRSTK